MLNETELKNRWCMYGCVCVIYIFSYISPEKNKGVYTHCKSISLKVNAITWLEIELAYYDVTLQYVCLFTLGTPPQSLSLSVSVNEFFFPDICICILHVHRYLCVRLSLFSLHMNFLSFKIFFFLYLSGNTSANLFIEISITLLCVWR